MAENDRSALVQELYKRRESLDPDRRAVVDELAKRLNISASEEPKGSAVERFASNFEEQANPLKIASGMGNAILHPIDAIKGYLAQNESLANKTTESFKNKHFMEGIRHGMNLVMQAIPGLGATSDAAGDQINAGDVAGGLGKAAGAGLAQVELVKAPKVMQKGAEAIYAAPEIPKRIAEVAKAPGNLNLAGGALETAAGAASFAHEPIAGSLLATRGVSRIIKGLGERKAAALIQESTQASRAADINAARLADNSRFDPRTPAWANGPLPTIPVPEEAVPIRGALPSGRTPGSIANQEPYIAPAPPPPPDPLLDQIAQGQMRGKLFKNLPLAQQEIVKALADRIRASEASPAASPSPAIVSRETVPVATPEPAATEATPPSEIESALQRSLDAIRAKKAAAGAIAAPSNQSVSVENSPTAVENSSKIVAPRAKGMGQAMKDATAMVDKLVEWDFTPDQVKGEAMNAKSWAKLAHDSGVPVPTTAAAKARVWEQLSRRLAGPPRSALDLIQGLKESLKANQK